MKSLTLTISLLLVFPSFAQTRGGGHPNPDNRGDSEERFAYALKKQSLLKDLNKMRLECFTNSDEIKSILVLRINIHLLKLKDSKHCQGLEHTLTVHEKEKWKCLLPGPDERGTLHEILENTYFHEEMSKEQLSEEEIKKLMEYFKKHIP